MSYPTKRQLVEALRYYAGQRSIFENDGDEYHDGYESLLNSRKYDKPVQNLHDFFYSVFELGDRTKDPDLMMVFKGDDTHGHPFVGYVLMSGEVVGGNFRFTLRRPDGNPGVMPYAVIEQETLKEIGGPDKLDGLGLEIFVEGQPKKVKGVSLDTFRLKDEADVFKLVKFDLEDAEGREIEQDVSATGRPERVGEFLWTVEELQKKSGRNIMREKMICVDDQDNEYSVIPSYSKNKTCVMFIQKIGPETENGWEGDESWTFGDICKWMKTQQGMERQLFLKSTKGAFEIQDMTFNPGTPPVVRIGPWGELQESGKVSAQQKTILEWKKYCDSDLLFW